MERTFIIAVEVPDVFPAVMAYDVDDSESVEWSNKDLKLSTFTPATHTQISSTRIARPLCCSPSYTVHVTQLSLTNRATHLCKCNGVADLY